eukprot:403377284
MKMTIKSFQVTNNQQTMNLTLNWNKMVKIKIILLTNFILPLISCRTWNEMRVLMEVIIFILKVMSIQYATYEELYGVRPDSPRPDSPDSSDRLNQIRPNKFTSGRQFGIISSYPSQVYKLKPNDQETVTCAVCIEDLTNDSMYKVLKCSHQFHSDCITKWLKVKLECPLCKETVNYQRPD